MERGLGFNTKVQMKTFFKNISLPVKIICLIVFITSVALGIHNAKLYNPDWGFDGDGHVYYINFLVNNHKMPPPTEWETHQPPLYYLVSAVVQTIFNSPKAVQYENIVIQWLIIIVVGLGFNKIFKNKYQVLLGMLALAALPMLSTFQPTVTNEYLSTFWIISAIVSSIYIYFAKTNKEFIKAYILLLLSLAFGVWTKISIITILPTVVIALFLSLKNIKKSIIFSALAILVFGLAYTPIYLRTVNFVAPSNIITTATNFSKVPPLNYFYRLDWIPKVDMYTTQYYSLLGGAWNSFWSDGQNVVTPFVPFHKKAFVLWSLGFILLPISLYGLWKHFRENKKISFIMFFFGLSMLGFYVFYNIVSFHYSAARLTYQMGIVLPYAFGIAAAAKNKKVFSLLVLLLAIQFIILISFYWIAPWWHVTGPRF
jgi:4-amino-4-deoxy-L-arabinose transferase-like glycosyltransferase